MNSLIFLTDSETKFPHPSLALEEPSGLLAVGGELTSQRLITAYNSGIFPWFDEEDPILWWSPNPRAIIVPGNLHISTSLKKFIKKSNWTITVNYDFNSVIESCSKPRLQQDATWITKDIQHAYSELHNLGHAHSIEVWDGSTLIGGLYGVIVGRVFCGESMFHFSTNASKVAMVYLEELLIKFDYALIDTQMMNPHLKSLGAKNINRDEFLTLLNRYKNQQIDLDCWLPRVIYEGNKHD